MAAYVICPNCGTIGRPKTVTEGSILIEIVLWLFFLIPGLIYSLWRVTSRNNACRKCKARALVPVESPGGRLLVHKFAATTPPPPPPSVIDFGFLRLVDGRVAAVDLGFAKLAGRSAVWSVRGCVICCVLLPVAVLYLIANRGSAAANAKQRETERRLAEIRANLPAEPVARREPEKATELNSGPTMTTLGGILDDYKSNAVRADGSWKNRIVSFRAQVTRVSTDIAGDPVVSVRTGDDRIIYRAACTTSKAQAVVLTAGGVVRVTGTCTGTTLGTLVVRDCTFEPTNPD